MLRNKTITHLFLALWLVMSLASCASDTASDALVPQDEKVYLQVQVNVDGSDATRASTGPNGGDDGDGRENGVDNENQVNSLAVLLYQSDKDDLSDDNATIDYVYTFSGLTSVSDNTNQAVSYKTAAREIDKAIVGKNYHVIVVANSEEQAQACKGKKISEIKDLVMPSVCTRDASSISAFKNFVMSSSKDAKLDFSSNAGKGTESDPYMVSVDIERLAARIDIVPNADYADNGYYYNVMDGDKVIGGFRLESVVPTKVMTSGEYLIKRVSSSSDLSNLVYFGKETAGTDNKTTNYIVCPWTKDHTNHQLSHAQGSGDFYKVRDVSSSSSTDKSFILDYVMENTTTDNAETYSTGLVFKGKYYKSSEWDKANKKPEANATGTDKEYTYTIRHSDPDGNGTASDPMYYGIVRNNIYQIKVEGVTGKEDGLKLTINVRKWATYTHEEATM